MKVKRARWVRASGCGASVAPSRASIVAAAPRISASRWGAVAAVGCTGVSESLRGEFPFE
jgi:hypothetical protein